MISSKLLKKEKKLTEIDPVFAPTKSRAINRDGTMFYFHGAWESINTTHIRITSLPYGASHEKYVEHLDKLLDLGKIQDYEDNSKNIIDITVKFKRGELAKLGDDKLRTLLKLIDRESENLTYIDVDGKSVQTSTAEEAIRKFTMWRLTWYYQRYEKLLAELRLDIQRYKDILLANAVWFLYS